MWQEVRFANSTEETCENRRREADRKLLELIQKFLKAGIMEDGNYLDSEKGTPQGGLCLA